MRALHVRGSIASAAAVAWRTPEWREREGRATAGEEAQRSGKVTGSGGRRQAGGELDGALQPKLQLVVARVPRLCVNPPL